jgi:hypothetical protein
VKWLISLLLLTATGCLPHTPGPTTTPSPSPTIVPSPAPSSSVTPTPTPTGGLTSLVAVAAQIGKKESAYLSTSEVAWIAQHYGTDSNPQAFIAIADFGTDCKTWTWIEDGVKANAALLHAANPKLRVIAYWGYHGDWHPTCIHAYTDPTFIANKATWEPKGILDISQQAVRDWWTTAAANRINNEGLDGLFIDGLSNQPGDPQQTYKQQLFAELRQKIGPGPLIIANGDAGNLTGSGLAPYIDGIMSEGIDRFSQGTDKTPATNFGYLQGAWSLAHNGKTSLLKEWPHPYDFTSSAWQAMTYAQQVAYARGQLPYELALYMAVEVPGHSAIMYSSGYDALGLFDIIFDPTFDPSTWNVDPTWYPQFLSPDLGVPIGDPTFNASALTIDRDFTTGHLHVDLNARTYTGLNLTP